MVIATVVHEPTDACGDAHCFWHNVDEPWPAGGAYIACMECRHVYRRARDLRRAYRRELRLMWWDIPDGWRPYVLRLRWWRNYLTARASRIDFCQYCTHDFWGRNRWES